MLYVFGGYTSDSAPSDELWSFDLADRVWRRIALQSEKSVAYASRLAHAQIFFPCTHIPILMNAHISVHSLHTVRTMTCL